MMNAEDLRKLLEKIDHRGYPAYKDTKGSYQFQEYILKIEHVQGDPFAAPSKVRIQVEGKRAGFPRSLYDSRVKRIALQDYLLRHFAREIGKFSYQAKGSGKSGLIFVSKCGQEILERSACQIDAETGAVSLCMEIGFPANGRTVNARELQKIVFDFVPVSVHKSLFYKSLKSEEIQQTAALAEDQNFIRKQLRERDLVAFIANDAILPRESGISDRPMKNAVKFQSPEAMELTMELPHRGLIKGMGIAKGVTLIVGGGYHGKSTLLKAIEKGVYNHIAGDGREYVITEETAFKIRAEDGRSIRNVDISMFIRNLPNGKDTKSFYSEDASGSTSQAANVIEGIEAGSKVLLIDEDTSATNFMIRDELMQRVVHKEKEPIIPFIDRVKELYDEYEISTILVAGSSGAYFKKANRIIQMDSYQPKDITAYARQEALRFYGEQTDEKMDCALPVFQRRVKADRNFGANERIKMKAIGVDAVNINKEVIDLRYVEQLVDNEQLNMLAYLIKYAQKHLLNGKATLSEVVDELYRLIEKRGMTAICEESYLPVNLAMPRKQELFACINRYRQLNF